MDRAAQDPAFADATRRFEIGDFGAARAGYLQLADRPELLAPALCQLGRIAAAQGDVMRAIGLLQQALAVAPALLLGYRVLAELQVGAGRMTAAQSTLLTLGNTLKAQGREEEALSVYAEILAQDPLHYGAAVNLGTVLAGRARTGDALRYLLWGLCLGARRMAGLDDLVAQAMAEFPDVVVGPAGQLPAGAPTGVFGYIEGALTTLGGLCKAQGHYALALTFYRRAVDIAPGYALGHWNLALALLGAGAYDEGWREYEWRWHWPDFPETRRHLGVPVWQGESLVGCRILVWSEQGLGDTLQFVPLIDRLCAQGAEVALEVPDPLVRLLAANLPMVRVIPRADRPHTVKCELRFDYAIPLLSLPQRLDLTADTLPLARGYLKPLPEDTATWTARLPQEDRLRVGLVWAGRPQHTKDAQRSLPFAMLQSLAAETAVDWYALQLGARRSELERLPGRQISDLAPYLDDFGQTAAALARLDLVVTVDTSVAHLAGAMGVPAWVLLPEPCDWRWGQNGTSCAWYPFVRLFRQTRPGHWETVIAQVKMQLATLGMEDQVARCADSS